MDKANKVLAAMKAELEAIDRDLISRFKAQNYKGSSPNKEVEVVISGDTGRLCDVRITSKDTGRALELLFLLAANTARDNYNEALKKNNEDYATAMKTISTKYAQQAVANLTSSPIGQTIDPTLQKIIPASPNTEPVNWGNRIFGGKSNKGDKKD